jgi:hypothetical protein
MMENWNFSGGPIWLALVSWPHRPAGGGFIFGSGGGQLVQ